MSYLETAVAAAQEAGGMLRENFHEEKVVDAAEHHDLKLELDRRCQEAIFARIHRDFPEHALYGEEGIGGNQESEYQWIVDPIDGTVNFFYGIPHFCVSVAMRKGEEILVGVIYDPMVDELWVAEKGGEALLNGKPIRVSERATIEESLLFVGTGKDQAAMDTGMERFVRASNRARKMRMMGSAALGMVYVASGRLDGFVESRLSLWDVAAGALILECAGGEAQLTPNASEPNVLAVVATNGKIPIEEIL
ncbi:MAG: inositol monophosphatase family protein [Verrucomicrobiota bacterium]